MLSVSVAAPNATFPPYEWPSRSTGPPKDAAAASTTGAMSACSFASE